LIDNLNFAVCLYQAVTKTRAIVISTVGHPMSIQQMAPARPSQNLINSAESKTGLR